VVAEHGGEGRF